MYIGKKAGSDIFKFENRKLCVENSKEEIISGMTIDN